MSAKFRETLHERPPPHDQCVAIFEKSCEEQLDGILSDWLTAQELDEMFGCGEWFGIFRFTL